MQRIHIGNQWVLVPPGYVRQESEYCREELDAFNEAVGGRPVWRPANADAEHAPRIVDEEAMERARQAVLDKRVEFWKRWNDTVAVPPSTNTIT